MTKEAALYEFWSSFDLPAYEENSVPTGEDAPDFPYLTYNVSTDEFGNEVAMNASIWYRSTSWLQCNQKAREISENLRGGKIIPCDGGRIWIKKGTPFLQNMGDPEDDRIKRKYIKITVEFLTAD